MAGARKLQAEIDRTMKKVDEGLLAFDEIYEQQKTAEGQSQKLKLEEDLKKEIKKLQKLREQVKSWAAGGEIKNKQPLLDVRHKIEQRMEVFKVVEREAKTKAYSKEGLMREQPMTAEEKKRAKSREWVQEIVSKLTDEVDLMEAELEALENADNKPKLKKGEKDPAAVLEVVVKNHHFHIDKLEALTRMLDNAAVDADAVDALKDDLEYYVSSAREPDFEADLELYAEFDLVDEGDEDDDDGTADDDDDDDTKAKAAAAKAKAAAPPPVDTKAAAKPAPAAAPAKVEPAKPATVPAPKAAPAPAPVAAKPAATTAAAAAKPIAPATPVKAPVAVPIAVPIASTAAGAATTAAGASAGPAASGSAPAAAPVKPAESLAAIVRGKAAAEAPAPAPPAAASVAPPAAPVSAAQAVAGKPSGLPATAAAPAAAVVPPTATATAPAAPAAPASVAILQRAGASTAAAAGTSTLDASAGGDAAAGSSAAAVTSSAAGAAAGAGVAASGATAATAASAGASKAAKAGAIGSARSEGATAVAAAAAAAAVVLPEPVLVNPWAAMPTQQARYCAAVVTSALATLPDASDSQLPRPYAPRQPYSTHASFPTTPSPLLETPSLFERFEPDTLFFIFYFSQGAYGQYLAAKELKKGGWRFNKKYGTWFLRQEEPKYSEDKDGQPTAETGSYAYFDYETGWASRTKTGFTFEYAHLEEEL